MDHCRISVMHEIFNLKVITGCHNDIWAQANIIELMQNNKIIVALTNSSLKIYIIGLPRGKRRWFVVVVHNSSYVNFNVAIQWADEILS